MKGIKHYFKVVFSGLRSQCHFFYDSLGSYYIVFVRYIGLWVHIYFWNFYNTDDKGLRVNFSDLILLNEIINFPKLLIVMFIEIPFPYNHLNCPFVAICGFESDPGSVQPAQTPTIAILFHNYFLVRIFFPWILSHFLIALICLHQLLIINVSWRHYAFPIGIDASNNDIHKQINDKCDIVEK